jgi:hypothetical protein
MIGGAGVATMLGDERSMRRSPMASIFNFIGFFPHYV